MKLAEKIKTALDETRLLILGAQVLLGFQLNGLFQDNFSKLPEYLRVADVFAFFIMVLTVALLISPSMWHRVAERGGFNRRMHRRATQFAAVALAPLALAMGIDLAVALTPTLGAAACAIGSVVSLLALCAWYLPMFWRGDAPMSHEEDGSTELHQKIEQMLTEARVMLPGAQALLGFQLSILLTSSFEALPWSSKATHIAALLAVAITVILLITPAAIHRLTYQGNDSDGFHRLGSAILVIAAIPLAIGLSLDLYVGVAKALASPSIAIAASSLIFICITALWFVIPMLARRPL